MHMYGCGIGPLLYGLDRKMSASVLNGSVDVMTLRDPDSLALLREIGVTGPELILSADPVLSVPPCGEEQTLEFMEANGLKADGSYVCLSLRPWVGFGEKAPCIAAALRRLCTEKGLTPVFLPMNYAKDEEVSRLVAELTGLEFVMLPEIRDPGLAIGVMSKMKLVAAMRLHSLLFAANGGTPSVGISYDPKVSGFVEYTGCGACIELGELTEDRLSELLLRLCGEDKQAELAENLKKVRAAEGRNLEAARRLMRRI